MLAASELLACLPGPWGPVPTRAFNDLMSRHSIVVRHGDTTTGWWDLAAEHSRDRHAAYRRADNSHTQRMHRLHVCIISYLPLPLRSLDNMLRLMLQLGLLPRVSAPLLPLQP